MLDADMMLPSYHYACTADNTFVLKALVLHASSGLTREAAEFCSRPACHLMTMKSPYILRRRAPEQHALAFSMGPGMIPSFLMACGDVRF